MNPIDVIFECKPDFKFGRAKVESIVRLSQEEFENFLHNPMADQEFIKEKSNLMYQDDKGVYHCILVTGEGHRDGAMVEAEARYASYIPDAAAAVYDSLSELGARLSCLVDGVIEEGIKAAKDCVSYKEIQEKSGLELQENPFLQELIADMIAEREEISCVNYGEDCFRIRFRQTHNQGEKEVEKMEAAEPSGQPTGGACPVGMLRELLNTRWENVHLVHDEIDFLPHTIMELNRNTLTGAGKKAWADVLNAKVLRVYQGYWGLQMECSGVKASRLADFAAMLGGYCSVEDYEQWVNEEPEMPHCQTVADS